MKKSELSELSSEELMCYRILFMCSVRLMSDVSAYLQGELRFKLKQDFNRVVDHAEQLVSEIEKTFSPEAKRAYEALVEDMTGEICKLRDLMIEELRSPESVTDLKQKESDVDLLQN